jgi:hypothetical protein
MLQKHRLHFFVMLHVVHSWHYFLQASEVLTRIQTFLNSEHDPDADTFLICYSGHGSEDGGKWCCDNNSYVSFDQVIKLWQVVTRLPVLLLLLLQ